MHLTFFSLPRQANSSGDCDKHSKLICAFLSHLSKYPHLPLECRCPKSKVGQNMKNCPFGVSENTNEKTIEQCNEPKTL